MKKLVWILLVCVMYSVGSLNVTAAEGGNVEVEGKIIFYDSGSQETPKKDEPKKDKPTTNSLKKSKTKGSLPKTGENRENRVLVSGVILTSIVLLAFVLRREGDIHEIKK